ncbi:MAG: FAD-binding oxidoreductase [Methylocystis sp.]|nr:FAD-binding oxidoreductase [Methylocystis sp.]MCA3584491.1 FAD-binding oxidoreductase [Methylocystis sp.]MCA3589300.1 FAD-binding oxidoreductase [Methylocystis sp.]MCA3591410.1 FAD-binding oxidoreductase [Methylocystis sp.]
MNTSVSRDLDLERRLQKAVSGEVRFDAFTRGRFATDASIYQMMPQGVVFPRSADDIAACLDIARRRGVPVIMRGGGTSQNGQPIGNGIVVDCSSAFNRLLDYDPEAQTVTVEPGMVLEQLNARLRADGLFFPVEPSTASRCTIGGMTGNNSCGARSIRYGKMVDNVLAVDALLASGEAIHFATHNATTAQALAQDMLRIAERERAEIIARYPKVQRRVGGYNLDSLIEPDPNLAHLLVGSEGTLAAFTAVTLKLSRLPAHRVMGVCHFPGFRAAMETTRHLVALGPVAVELVDSNVLALGADIPLFRRTLADITKGQPDCLLLVEFAGDSLDDLKRDLKRLDQCMADHGFPDAIVEVIEPARQKQVWEVREACLNIMMSMKGDGKPVSFIEDCAVPLDRLADYTAAVTDIFASHGTRGTWYAHASVGCLHVRPILNMKTAEGVKAMRSIAEETAALVKRFEGSYSGEHGDGISRSEFIEPLFGARLTAAFSEVKQAFDPENRLNPGKIVEPLRFDDRRLMRFGEGYRTALPGHEALDWSAAGGFGQAIEMCNNNGACRKLSGGAMCPSYRVTKDETHVTRGRANALRLAISGQLGADAFTSPAMKEAMDLCVGCKACQRECPTGVDMAKMKVEFLSHYHARHGLPLKERLVAHLPRYAGWAAKLAPLLNLRDQVPGLAALSEKLLGFSARRSLPVWREPWRETGAVASPADVAGDGLDVILWGDTFNRAFERENLEAATRVLKAAGYRLHRIPPQDGGRALCCGRTYLACGQVAEARKEAARTAEALLPFIARGAKVVGLEPSCLLTLRDEFGALLPKEQAEPIKAAALLIEELLAADLASGKVSLPLKDQAGRKAHLHGHCHQKAADAMGAVEACLKAVPGLSVTLIESSCCGMAGAFGYDARHIDVSLQMAELSLLPAVRKADADDIIVADGASCRHQIRDGADREAVHVVRVLDGALR